MDGKGFGALSNLFRSRLDALGQQIAEVGLPALQQIEQMGAIARVVFLDQAPEKVELARRAGRRKVTLVHKANILKTVSGLFLEVARQVAADYPDIQCDEMIVDATCMKLVMDPHQFDMIVTTNLFGDIISDLCAGLVGGLGLAPGANIGHDAAIFEAVHGSAPDIAGRGIANPCALLLAAAQMLTHLDMADRAQRLRAAITAAIADGDRVTPDLGGEGTTDSFADAIIARI